MITKLKTIFQNWQNQLKIKRCARKSHSLGMHITISSTGLTDWEPTNVEDLYFRTSNLKCKCSNCGTVFLKNGIWEFRDSVY